MRETDAKQMRRMKFDFSQQKVAPNVHKMYIYDDVSKYGEIDPATWEYRESETSAKYISARLDEIPNTDTIELHVNSNGGDVNEGVAIMNALRQKAQAGCKIIGYVDGAAYSIAMDIVLGCSEIHMGLGTTMFLHYPWTIAVGNKEQLLSVALQLEAMGNASVQLYLAHSKNLTETELKEMMEKETMLDPEACLHYGFCDVIDDYSAKELEEPEEEPEDTEPEERDEPDDIEEPDDAEEPEEVGDADDADGDDEDDKDKQIRQLKEQITALKQAKEPDVTKTLFDAFDKLSW